MANQVIDVGLAAIVRNISVVAGYTHIVEDNPANVSGTIIKVEIYAKWEFTGLQIGIFYSTGTDKFSTRSTVTITTGIVTAGYHIYNVSLAVQAGDYIGFYATSANADPPQYSGTIYGGQSTTTGRWAIAGDQIPCTNVTFAHATDDPCGLISLYGYTLAVVPTVTTQAVDNISFTTATGNGNITALGGENATRRGFCYMVGDSGDPTIANSIAYDDGDFGTGAYTKGLTGLSPGTTYRVRAYAVNSAGVGYGTTVQFTTDKIAVTTQDATEVGQNQVKGNGNITALGGEDATERGFEYGLTQTPTWTKKETAGGYGTGAFSLVIDSLEVNTSYWYRAYAVNSTGTGYGEWVQFQTAASGTIPTGALLNICSDYSGCTYQLEASETDDGATYESYFVLSTDLADKQGLHFNKRLEDLFSYFKKKDSGTCKIYVKCDNEAEWEYAGEVSMMGEEDIIIKHLPSDNEDTSGDVDFFAKTYLIKFVFQNDFEFIGLVTEAIPEGER